MRIGQQNRDETLPMKSDWSKKSIGDLGKIVTGKTPSTKISDYWNGDIPFVTPKDIQGTKHILSTERAVSLDGLRAVHGSVLPDSAVCVSCIGNIGYLGITTKTSVSNQQINSIIVNAENDKDFVYYLLKSLWPFFKNFEGQSTTLSILNKSQFSKISVLVPDLNTQKRIASILSALDDKIELNTQINDNLLQQAQGIYHSWFIDYGPFEGKKPSNWRDGTITDLAKEIICGKTPSTKKSEYYGEDIPFITIPDMHGKVYTVTTERYLSALGVESQPGKVLCKNSVCVSCIGTAGLVTLVATTSQTNQQINSIIPKDGYSPYYIYLLMQTLSETINKLGQSGSTIVNLNKAQFSKIKVTIPPVEVMKSLDDILMPIFELILAHQKENIKLASLRDALLPRLMSGELDVAGLKI